MKDYIIGQFKISISVKEACLKSEKIIAKIESMGRQTADSLKNGKKVLLFGNGGSASDAQHIAAELVGRFETERSALPAIALPCNISNITAIGNDYGFEYVYSRQIEALGQKGDIAIGISTSGNSKNVILALKKAKEKQLLTFGWTGESDCQMDEICDIILHIPSKTTARIQECHILSAHIICGIIDRMVN